MANSVDYGEMANYEPFHLDLHCLQKYLSSFIGLKGLINYFKLRELDHLVVFLPFYKREITFVDFLNSFLHTKTLLKRGLL